MRLIVVGWRDADWDKDTEHRMVKLVLDTLRSELPNHTVPPNSAELLPTFTAEQIRVALGLTPQGDTDEGFPSYDGMNT